MIYHIPEVKSEAFVKKLNQLRNKFIKHNIQFSFQELGEYYADVEISDEVVTVRFISYEVIADKNLKIGDYRVIASIERDPEDNGIVRLYSSEKLPEGYDVSDFSCDHCHSLRARRKVFILRDNNTQEYKRVGSACMKDYTGISAEIISSYYTSLDELDEFSIPESGSRYFKVDDVLVSAIRAINKTGEYVSNYKAATEDKKATRDIVHSILLGCEDFRFIPYESSDDSIKSEISTLKEVILNSSSESEYFNSLISILSGKYCTNRDLGLVCSAIPASRKLVRDIELAAKNEALAETSKYVGEVGEKLEFTGCVEFIKAVDSFYGSSRLYRITDSDNNVYIWFYSGYSDIKDGSYKICGTVKKHEEYNNVKQTLLTRCKLSAFA